MEILGALLGAAFLLWYFVARPRAMSMRYQLHKDTLATARSLLERYADRERVARIPWELRGHLMHRLENLQTHVDDTQLSELGGRDLRELFEDVAFVEAVDRDKIHGEQRQAFRALAFDAAAKDLQSADDNADGPLAGLFPSTTATAIANLEDGLRWEWDPRWPLPKTLDVAADLVRRAKERASRTARNGGPTNPRTKRLAAERIANDTVLDAPAQLAMTEVRRQHEERERDEAAPPPRARREEDPPARAPRRAKIACDVCGELSANYEHVDGQRVCLTCQRRQHTCARCGAATLDWVAVGSKPLCRACFRKQAGRGV